MSAVAAACLLSACSAGRLQIEEHDLSTADRSACQGLVDDLPATLAGEQRRSVEPEDALGAAWGDRRTS